MLLGSFQPHSCSKLYELVWHGMACQCLCLWLSSSCTRECRALISLFIVTIVPLLLSLFLSLSLSYILCSVKFGFMFCLSIPTPTPTHTLSPFVCRRCANLFIHTAQIILDVRWAVVLELLFLLLDAADADARTAVLRVCLFFILQCFSTLTTLAHQNLVNWLCE